MSRSGDGGRIPGLSPGDAGRDSRHSADRKRRGRALPLRPLDASRRNHLPRARHTSVESHNNDQRVTIVFHHWSQLCGTGACVDSTVHSAAPEAGHLADPRGPRPAAVRAGAPLRPGTGRDHGPDRGGARGRRPPRERRLPRRQGGAGQAGGPHPPAHRPAPHREGRGGALDRPGRAGHGRGSAIRRQRRSRALPAGFPRRHLHPHRGVQRELPDRPGHRRTGARRDGVLPAAQRAQHDARHRRAWSPTQAEFRPAGGQPAGAGRHVHLAVLGQHEGLHRNQCGAAGGGLVQRQPQGDALSRAGCSRGSWPPDGRPRRT